MVTTAGLVEGDKTRWQLFCKLPKKEALRIEPAGLRQSAANKRHRPAPKDGANQYLWVVACEKTWVELRDKSCGYALLPSADKLRAVYIQAVQCDAKDMPIASKVLHLGIVPSEPKMKPNLSRSCNGFRAETPTQSYPALEATPLANGAPPTKVAPNQNKRRVVEESEDSDVILCRGLRKAIKREG